MTASLCPFPGRSGDLHGEPRAVLQEVLRFHHHYPVIASRSDGGHRGTMKGRAKGKRARQRGDGEGRKTL